MRSCGRRLPTSAPPQNIQQLRPPFSGLQAGRRVFSLLRVPAFFFIHNFSSSCVCVCLCLCVNLKKQKILDRSPQTGIGTFKNSRHSNLRSHTESSWGVSEAAALPTSCDCHTLQTHTHTGNIKSHLCEERWYHPTGIPTFSHTHTHYVFLYNYTNQQHQLHGDTHAQTHTANTDSHTKPGLHRRGEIEKRGVRFSRPLVSVSSLPLLGLLLPSISCFT